MWGPNPSFLREKLGVMCSHPVVCHSVPGAKFRQDAISASPTHFSVGVAWLDSLEGIVLGQYFNSGLAESSVQGLTRLQSHLRLSSVCLLAEF